MAFLVVIEGVHLVEDAEGLVVDEVVAASSLLVVDGEVLDSNANEEGEGVVASYIYIRYRVVFIV